MIDLILITFTLVVFAAGFVLGRSWTRIKLSVSAGYGRFIRFVMRVNHN